MVTSLTGKNHVFIRRQFDNGNYADWQLHGTISGWIARKQCKDILVLSFVLWIRMTRYLAGKNVYKWRRTKDRQLLKEKL